MYIDVRGVYPILVDGKRTYTLPHTFKKDGDTRHWTVAQALTYLGLN